MWNIKTNVMPVETVANGTVSNNLESPVKYLQVSSHVRLSNGEYSDVSSNTSAVIIMIVITDMVNKMSFYRYSPT
jgi:hypothetical protein